MEVVSRMIQLHPYRRLAHGIEYLVLKRAPDEPIYPNLWQVVTGMVEEGETAPETAKRELYEEAGINVDSVLVLPFVGSFYSHTSDSIHQVPVFAAELPEDCVVRLSEEHCGCLWADFDTAMTTLVLPSHKHGCALLRDVLQGDLMTGFIPSI